MDAKLKEVEEVIKLAVEVDMALPQVFRVRYRCTLGFLSPSLEVIQDRLLNEEPQFVVTEDDFKIWDMVCSDWLPMLEPKLQKIVWWKCSGMGWRRIAWLLKKHRYTQTEFSRWTLKDLYSKGLEKIYKNFC